MQPGNSLLRHTEKMLTVASFRPWRISHHPAAQGHSPTAGKRQGPYFIFMNSSEKRSAFSCILAQTPDGLLWQCRVRSENIQ